MIRVKSFSGWYARSRAVRCARALMQQQDRYAVARWERGEWVVYADPPKEGL